MFFRSIIFTTNSRILGTYTFGRPNVPQSTGGDQPHRGPDQRPALPAHHGLSGVLWSWLPPRVMEHVWGGSYGILGFSPKTDFLFGFFVAKKKRVFFFEEKKRII